MRQRLIQLAKTPEVVLPIGVLAMAIVLLVVAIASLRPDSTVAAALIAAVAAGYGTVISLTVTRFFERQKEAALRMLELERDARAKKVPAGLAPSAPCIYRHFPDELVKREKRQRSDWIG